MRVFGAIGAIAAMCAFGMPAQAMLIIPDFGTSITTAGNSAAIEATIDAAIAEIDGLIVNPLTLHIDFQTASLSGGGLGTSTQTLMGAFYSTVRAELSSDAATHASNAVLATAVANLPTGFIAPDGVTYSTTGQTLLYLTQANYMLLGNTTSPCYDSSGNYVGCSAGNGGTDVGVVTLSNASSGSAALDWTRPVTPTTTDAVRVVLHEIDEILGIGGGGSMLGNQTNAIGMTDLYRYTAANTPSYATGATGVYLSINKGVTAIVAANQTAGGDYGDFGASGCTAYVQQAFTCQNHFVAGDWLYVDPGAGAWIAGAAGHRHCRHSGATAPSALALIGRGAQSPGQCESAT